MLTFPSGIPGIGIDPSRQDHLPAAYESCASPVTHCGSSRMVSRSLVDSIALAHNACD
jgi:hypothetical protein